MNKEEFTNQFTRDLVNLGVRPSGPLLVHSALKPFKHVPGGPNTIIEALTLTMTGEGTLAMPALSYENVTHQNPFFDLRKTPSCVGLIAETFRQKPVRRSLHPTHSVSAFGPASGRLLDHHIKDNTPCGGNSPFHILPHLDGQILMLGCGLAPNTSMHAIEELVEPPYLFGSQNIYTLVDDAKKIYQKSYTNHNFKGWMQRYDRIEMVLSAPDLKTGMVVGVQSYIIEAPALWDKAHDCLRQNPLYFIDRM
jgi:aminoglycoside 3-N-acetyltransferase